MAEFEFLIAVIAGLMGLMMTALTVLLLPVSRRLGEYLQKRVEALEAGLEDPALLANQRDVEALRTRVRELEREHEEERLLASDPGADPV